MTLPDFALSCPAPLRDYPRVVMAHGGGGRIARQLIEKLFAAAFSNPALNDLGDAALLDAPPAGSRLAFATDSHVVSPLFFPGGDIGSLAVHGTVNDLAMVGAQPLYLSAGFILEEGLEMETLWRVVQSMREAAQVAGVRIVAGDTKVVDRGKGDGLYINTAGVGFIPAGRSVGASEIRPGDAILVSGDIGRHGMAVMTAREGLGFDPPLESDSAPLNGRVEKLFASGAAIHAMRDATRGGLAAVLIELAEASGQSFRLRESAVPVAREVRSACELLGIDPLHVACEGRFAVFVAAEDAQRALEILRADPLGRDAAIIGAVEAATTRQARGLVALETPIGSSRALILPAGEQLPRIC